jgi:hypothetical protein
MKFQMTIPVKGSGEQVWEVEADSAAEALRKQANGEGEVAHEEIEVTPTGKPYNVVPVVI